jgi:hypothetical protein
MKFTHSKTVWNPKDEYRCTVVSDWDDHPDHPDIIGTVCSTPEEALTNARKQAGNLHLLRQGHGYRMEHRTVSSWCFW